MNVTAIIILLSVGLAAGYLSGLVGIGGGLVIVPVLVLALSYSQQLAQGTTLFMFLFPIGILGVMQYYKNGNVDWKAAVLIGSTFIIGSYYGSKAAVEIDEALLKKIFGSFIILIGLKLIFFK